MGGWVSSGSPPPPMVMVVTVPLRQPCTTAWSYVHNGFRAAGEGPPPCGMVARLDLVPVACFRLTTLLENARRSSVDRANTSPETMQFYWFS